MGSLWLWSTVIVASRPPPSADATSALKGVIGQLFGNVISIVQWRSRTEASFVFG